MAQEYVLIKEKQDSGLIALSKAVFETIAFISIDEEENVYPLEKQAMKKTVQCKISDNKLIVLVDARVKYGANVNELCEKLQERITTNIYQMTNLKCNNIDIKVSGFVF